MQVQYGEVTVHRLSDFRLFTCTLGVINNAAKQLGGSAHRDATLQGHACKFTHAMSGPPASSSDDLDPAFDDFRPNALEPAHQLVDHVKEHTVTTRLKAL